MTFVKRIAIAAALGAATLIGTGLTAPPSQAAYIVTLEQVGSNVVATGSGSIDLSDLTIVTIGGGFGAFIQPNNATIFTGPTASTTDELYSSITGPSSYGSGGPTNATTGSGDFVGIIGVEDDLRVPLSYVSGTMLSDTSTYNGQTFGSLGVTPGTYVWTWGTGADADSFTLQIGPAVAPAPALSGLPLLALLLGRGGFLAARRLRATRSSFATG